MTTSFQPVKSMSPPWPVFLLYWCVSPLASLTCTPYEHFELSPLSQKRSLMDRRLDLDLVRDSEVLELPRADEVVMQLQALLPVVRVIGRKLDRCIFVGDVDDPHVRQVKESSRNPAPSLASIPMPVRSRRSTRLRIGSSVAFAYLSFHSADLI